MDVDVIAYTSFVDLLWVSCPVQVQLLFSHLHPPSLHPSSLDGPCHRRIVRYLLYFLPSTLPLNRLTHRPHTTPTRLTAFMDLEVLTTPIDRTIRSRLSTLRRMQSMSLPQKSNSLVSQGKLCRGEPDWRGGGRCMSTARRLPQRHLDPPLRRGDSIDDGRVSICSLPDWLKGWLAKSFNKRDR